MSNNRTELIHEAYRQSEKNLESDISLGIAADQRAMGFCGWMVAAAALLIGLAGNAANAVNSVGIHYVGALFLILAALLAGYSARPVIMRAPGAKFSGFTSDIEGDVAMSDVLMEMGGHNDEQSEENRKKLKSNGRLISISFILATLGLSLPIVVKLPDLVTWICGG